MSDTAKRGHLHFSVCTLHFALCILLFGCGRSEPVTAAPVATAAAAEPSAPRVARADARGPKAGGGRGSIRPTRRRSARRWRPAWPRRRRRGVQGPASWRSSRRTPGTSTPARSPAARSSRSAPAQFQRVIVLGPSHYGAFRGFSIMDAGAYRHAAGRRAARPAGLRQTGRARAARPRRCSSRRASTPSRPSCPSSRSRSASSSSCRSSSATWNPATPRRSPPRCANT